VRAAYDGVAVIYAELFADALATQPVDRALLAAFAELVTAAGGGAVGDLGCGPGPVAAHLAGLGLDVFGVDLSPVMVGLARQAFPQLRFDVGLMASLDLPAGGLGGIVSWYSVIHTPPDELPATFAEFHRVLAPGGRLLVAFQGADAVGGPAVAFAHKVTTGFRWPVDTFVALLADGGFVEEARLVRPPGDTERFPQARLLLRRDG
jgi:SAM-dependent methyltransferase